ncbi:uncharacterized protein B0T23DRAFT_371233 [Neurospora hispaniola]|uniref:Uncharacterized protein n=1 Tax=Neurospora hispaniola TaxID=588809 RepID=A0AAJ0MW59_9PEZI|nr:hypothetical protein B0T23DRAFT_371233 [Neurospora hispaniola]
MALTLSLLQLPVLTQNFLQSHSPNAVSWAKVQPPKHNNGQWLPANKPIQQAAGGFFQGVARQSLMPLLPCLGHVSHHGVVPSTKRIKVTNSFRETGLAMCHLRLNLS